MQSPPPAPPSSPILTTSNSRTLPQTPRDSSERTPISIHKLILSPNYSSTTTLVPNPPTLELPESPVVSEKPSFQGWSGQIKNCRIYSIERRPRESETVFLDCANIGTGAGLEDEIALLCLDLCRKITTF